MRRKLIPTGAISCALLLAVTACGGGGGGEETPEVNAAAEGSVSAADAEALGGEEAVTAMQELYEAAQTAGETTVNVYGPGENDKVALYEVFSQRFPGISVTGTYLVGPEFAAKVQAEFASGQHVADMVQGGDTSVAPWLEEGKFVEFAPVTAEELDAGFQDEGDFLTAATGSTFGFVYNTNLMPEAEAPQGWEDLTDPAYQGKMTAEPPTRNGGAFGTVSHLLWDGRYDEEYLRALAAQDIAFQASGPVAGAAVATGQYALNPFYPYSFYLRDKEQGAPVAFVFPTEGGAHISPHYLGVLDGAPNPNAAKLLTTWLFTPEGQQAASDVGYYPLMPDSPAPEGYPSVNELDLLKPFPISEVAEISAENLATAKRAFGAE
ncbi:ABC transporter substrate-binding protein [Modestobacter lapidis]|nr:extracellular solute-binding protein [Modestobacter lapidis]